MDNQKHNAQELPPEEADRLIELHAPRLLNQILEQCWQDKRVARRLLERVLSDLDPAAPAPKREPDWWKH